VDISEYSRDYAIGSDAKSTDYIPNPEQATFNGIVRDDGQVATRNYIGVLPGVADGFFFGRRPKKNRTTRPASR
jgi:altronate hydrolase